MEGKSDDPKAQSAGDSAPRLVQCIHPSSPPGSLRGGILLPSIYLGQSLRPQIREKMNPSGFIQLCLPPILQVRAVQADRARSPVLGVQHQLHARSRQRPHPSPPLQGSPRRRSQLQLQAAFIHQAASKNPLKAVQGPVCIQREHNQSWGWPAASGLIRKSGGILAPYLCIMLSPRQEPTDPHVHVTEMLFSSLSAAVNWPRSGAVCILHGA